TPALAGGVHNVQLDRSGTFGVLTINQTTLGHKVFWEFGTNTINDSCKRCISHWACDFGVCLWDLQHQTTYDMQLLEIPGDRTSLPGLRAMNKTALLRSSAGPVPAMDTTSALGQWEDDEHASHANASQNATNIFLVSWQPNIGRAIVTS